MLSFFKGRCRCYYWPLHLGHADCWTFHPVPQDAQGEEDEEDGASEAASLEEPKEEDQGEGYLSEMDNEPPVSESDDGFSIHNAPLQSHTLADSIPSSPASSQL